MKIRELPIPEELIRLVESFGYSDLYPPQEEAVKAGVLEGRNLLLTTPTASGKTLVAMLAAGKIVLEGLGKVVYLTPLRALANEKYNDFKAFEKLTKNDGNHVRVLISTGDYDSSGESLGAGDILILTNEKFDSILRHGVSWIDSVRLFVTDEIHIVGDDYRGPTLEMTVTKILSYADKSQVLALSATVKNSKELANWLGAKLIDTRWRPIKLVEGVYQQGEISFSDGSTRKIKPTNRGHAIDVAIDTVSEGGQSLIFTETRRMAVSLALKASEVTQHYLTKAEAEEAKELSRSVISAGEETELSRTLSKAVEKGTAFHHAGLAGVHRSIIENGFKNGLIKILTATPTLCLLPGTKLAIAGNRTLKEIEKLSSNDKALTHTGQFKKVIQPLQRQYSGEVITIYPYYQLPMTMTPEHMVLCSRRVRRSIHRYKQSKGCRYKNYTVHWYEYKPVKWVKAKFLRQNDLVLFPRLSEERDIEYLNLSDYGIETFDGLFKGANQYCTYWFRNRPYHNIPKKLQLSNDLLWLFGCYIAEGVANKGAIIFNIGSHEDRLRDEIIKRIKKVFGITPFIKDSGSKRRVVVCSRALARLFKAICGGRAREKHILYDFLHLPRHKLICLLQGLWAGDGTYGEYEDSCSARYNTVSEELAHQIYLILVKLGYIPSIKRRLERPGSFGSTGGYVLSISGRQLNKFCHEVIKAKRSYKGKRTYNIGNIDENFVYLPIRRIERKQYTGPVYNLEVADDSSYVGSFIVHNSAGVNLPARRVVISSLMRYDSDYGGKAPISVLEYKQMCGRAGRPKYDDIGETVIIAHHQYDADEILYNYIKGEPEPLRSKLHDESALRTHLLATVASLPGITDAEILKLLSKSLLAIQYRHATIQSKVNKVMNYLSDEGLIERRGKRYIASEFGKRVSTLYIDPLTGVMFRRAINFAEKNKPHLLGYLHLIVSSPDFAPKFPLRNRDVDEAQMLFDQNRDEFLLPMNDQYYEDHLEDFRSLLVLYGWINEWSEDKILDKLGVEPGDLHRAVETSEWLVHSLFELSKLLGRADLLPEIAELEQRIEQGIRSELIPLAKLEGVGRIRARSLYNHGFTDIDKLASASIDKIASVPKIGTTIAKSIKKQLSRGK
ncbi:MAG: DEAD/DEAH box helicase [Nitrososphaerales archaeon]